MLSIRLFYHEKARLAFLRFLWYLFSSNLDKISTEAVGWTINLFEYPPFN